MTSDIDLGVDFEELEQEIAKANRPTYNLNPIRWRGKLASITSESETFKDQSVHPRVAFNFENIKVLEAGHCQLQEGDAFTLLVEPQAESVKRGAPNALTPIAKTTHASGEKLNNFVGEEVEVTEIVRIYKKNNGYDGYDYSWKFERVGAASNGASADKDAKFKAAEEAAEIALGSTEWESESAFRTAWLNNPAVNQLSPDFNTLVMLGKWEGFKNLGTPAA